MVKNELELEKFAGSLSEFIRDLHSNLYQYKKRRELRKLENQMQLFYYFICDKSNWREVSKRHQKLLLKTFQQKKCKMNQSKDPSKTEIEKYEQDKVKTVKKIEDYELVKKYDKIKGVEKVYRKFRVFLRLVMEQRAECANGFLNLKNHQKILNKKEIWKQKYLMIFQILFQNHLKILKNYNFQGQQQEYYVDMQKFHFDVFENLNDIKLQNLFMKKIYSQLKIYQDQFLLQQEKVHDYRKENNWNVDFLSCKPLKHFKIFFPIFQPQELENRKKDLKMNKENLSPKDKAKILRDQILNKVQNQQERLETQVLQEKKVTNSKIREEIMQYVKFFYSIRKVKKMYLIKLIKRISKKANLSQAISKKEIYRYLYEMTQHNSEDFSIQGSDSRKIFCIRDQSLSLQLISLN